MVVTWCIVAVLRSVKQNVLSSDHIKCITKNEHLKHTFH